jgi:putative endonuclease
MYYVYILKSKINGSYYKGSTENLQRRIREHNEGKEIYTSRLRPWDLVWYCEKTSLSEARKLEYKLKNITSVKRLEVFIKKFSVGGPDAQA